ncbi:hypothetical protein [Microbispora sp. NPDC049125]|uniref:hypothetical protein n=1 Tax=Microbispora sp. NPDC049125 TaxID=3154929 RepID=UPI0034654BED
MDVSQALTNMIKSELGRKEFSTGSKGFYGSDKITAEGVRYQAQAQAVLIGSKEGQRLAVQATPEQMSAALAGLIMDSLTARRFRTGRTGYRADGKIEAHGQWYQASVQAVRLS